MAIPATLIPIAASWRRDTPPLPEFLFEVLDGRAGADGRRLVGGRLADRGADQVGGAYDRLRLRRVLVLQLGRDGLPARAAQQVRRVGRARQRVLVAKVDERDAPGRVVLAQQLLLGRARRLQRLLVAVARLHRAEVDVVAGVGRAAEREGGRVRIDVRGRGGRGLQSG